MYDANSQLQSLVTKTTSFNSTGFDLQTGTPRRGLKARVIATNYRSTGTAGTVFKFSIDESDDNTTFQTVAYGPFLTGATSPGSTSEMFIPFETSKRYVRLAMEMNPSSGTPTITYQAEIGIARP